VASLKNADWRALGKLKNM